VFDFLVMRLPRFRSLVARVEILEARLEETRSALRDRTDIRTGDASAPASQVAYFNVPPISRPHANRIRADEAIRALADHLGVRFEGPKNCMQPAKVVDKRKDDGFGWKFSGQATGCMAAAAPQWGKSAAQMHAEALWAAQRQLAKADELDAAAEAKRRADEELAAAHRRARAKKRGKR